MKLCYVVANGGPALILTDPALASMTQFQQTTERDKEAGGQLFAIFEGSDTVIVEATPPKLLDWRTRRRFRPNRILQRREIRCRYKRGLHFVGDWHTHPEAIPHPSADDLNSMQECFTNSLHDLRAFVLITLGTDPPPIGLHVAVVDPDSVQPLSLDRNLVTRLNAHKPAFSYDAIHL